MKHYKFVDYATQVYFAFVGLLVLGFHGDHLPVWPWLLLVQGAGLASIDGLIRLAARWLRLRHPDDPGLRWLPARPETSIRARMSATIRGPLGPHGR